MRGEGAVLNVYLTWSYRNFLGVNFLETPFRRHIISCCPPNCVSYFLFWFWLLLIWLLHDDPIQNIHGEPHTCVHTYHTYVYLNTHTQIRKTSSLLCTMRCYICRHHNLGKTIKLWSMYWINVLGSSFLAFSHALTVKWTWFQRNRI